MYDLKGPATVSLLAAALFATAPGCSSSGSSTGVGGSGASSGTGGALGGGGSSATDGGGGARCGASVCGSGSFCCGPRDCGFCAPNGSGPFCGFTCSDAGTGGAGGGGGASGTSGSGGSAGFAGSCDQLSCTGAATCRCCPAGGPAQYCTCTTACTSNADCRDPGRPTCDIDQSMGQGICRDASFTCCWGCF